MPDHVEHTRHDPNFNAAFAGLDFALGRQTDACLPGNEFLRQVPAETIPADAIPKLVQRFTNPVRCDSSGKHRCSTRQIIRFSAIDSF